MTRYYVVIYIGSSPPRYARSLGPFESADEAANAIEDEGLTGEPFGGEWATIIPDPLTRDEGDA